MKTISSRVPEVAMPIMENRYMLRDGKAFPMLDNLEWTTWAQGALEQLKVRIPVGKKTIVGIRFPGHELGMSRIGHPLLWQIAVFVDKKLTFAADVNCIERLDAMVLVWKPPSGFIKHLLSLKIGLLGRLRFTWGYLRWRKNRSRSGLLGKLSTTKALKELRSTSKPS